MEEQDRYAYAPEGEAWRIQAACRDVDPRIFFPSSSDEAADLSIRAAKAVCALCTVRMECLEYAYRMNIEHGIWGGIGERGRIAERRAWLARQRRASS
jgi:WhiB family redox-sensing transcriptional regulator